MTRGSSATIDWVAGSLRTSFVDRSSEMGDVLRLLSDDMVRLVTLTGLSGVGKTRLAIECVERLDDRPSVLVPLSPHSQNCDVGLVIAGELDAARVAADERAVVIVDNVEHLVGAGEQIDRFLARYRNITALVTSTRPLGLADERMVSIGPLGTSDVDGGDDSALLLFADRAASTDSRFRLDGESRHHVADVCWLLGGLPLAIELAAARIAVLPPAAMASELRDGAGLSVLRDDTRAAERQRTVIRALSWTTDLLPAPARSLLARLAVFASSFTLSGAAAVGGDDPGQTLDLLAVLIDARLVESTSGTDRAGTGRFHLLPPVRTFAWTVLADHQDRTETQARYSALVSGFAQRAAELLDRCEHRAAFALLDAEWDEISSVVAWCARTGDAAAGLRIAVDCAPYLVTVGYDATAHLRLEQLIEMYRRVTAIDRLLLAKALLWSAVLTRESGDPRSHAAWAKQRLAEGLEIARAADSQRTIVLGLELSAMCLPVTGDLAGTADAISEALSRARGLADERLTARIEALAAMIAHQRGDLLAAAALAVQALQRARACAEPRATVLATLALIGLPPESAPPDIAWPDPDELLRLCRDIRDRHAESYVLAAEAKRAALAGERHAAARRCAEHLRLVRRRGAVDTTAPALTITTLVLVAAETGALQDAAVLYGSVEQNLASAETVMTPEWLRRFRAAILTCRRGLGIRRFDQARERGHRLSSAQAVAEAIAFAQTIHAGADVQPTSALDTLTRRERQVLELLARGYSNAGIAAQLDLSVKTVMHHTSAIYRKLCLRGRAEAIAAAFDAGLV